MDTDFALALMKQMLWVSLQLAGPLLIVTLVTGLVISVFQVATQLQEMTLSYVAFSQSGDRLRSGRRHADQFPLYRKAPGSRRHGHQRDRSTSRGWAGRAA